MQLVIDIDKDDYEYMKNGYVPSTFNIFSVIKNGTPLPEEHGRLGDLDAVMSDISTSIEALTNLGIAVEGDLLWAKLNDAIYNAPTIIEADKAESEE